MNLFKRKHPSYYKLDNEGNLHDESVGNSGKPFKAQETFDQESTSNRSEELEDQRSFASLVLQTLPAPPDQFDENVNQMEQLVAFRTSFKAGGCVKVCVAFDRVCRIYAVKSSTCNLQYVTTDGDVLRIEDVLYKDLVDSCRDLEIKPKDQETMIWKKCFESELRVVERLSKHLDAEEVRLNKRITP
jgi:hypothetical protein